MDDYLEKIDIVRERTGVSYRQAREILEKTGGDVVQALAELEEKERHIVYGTAGEIYRYAKEILRRGQATRVRIKQGDRTVLEIPVNLGVAGIIAAMASSEIALLGALGGVAAMAKKYTLEIERQPSRDEEVYFGAGEFS